MGKTIEETITVNGNDIEIKFTEAQDVTRLEGNATVNVLGVAALKGDFYFEKSNVNATTTQLLVGVDNFEAFFGNNYQQPDAIGVQLTNGQLGLIIEKDGTNDSVYAISSSGDAEFIGIDGLTIEGSLGLAVNRMGKTIEETITVNGNDIEIKFTEAQDVTRLQGDDVTVNVLGVAGSYG
jgi:hypothetical protein